MTTTIHPDHHLAAVRAAHAETLRQARDWLGLSDAFIGDTGELVVRRSGVGDAELREELAEYHLLPGVLRAQVIALAERVQRMPPVHVDIFAPDKQPAADEARGEDWGNSRAADLTTWNANTDRLTCERLAPLTCRRMNDDPRVRRIRQLAAKEPEDLCAPGTMREVLSAVDLDDSWPEEDRSMFVEMLCALLPERQLDAIAERAQVELDKLAEIDCPEVFAEVVLLTAQEAPR